MPTLHWWLHTEESGHLPGGLEGASCGSAVSEAAPAPQRRPEPEDAFYRQMGFCRWTEAKDLEMGRSSWRAPRGPSRGGRRAMSERQA